MRRRSSTSPVEVGDADARTDIYQLGKTLYELLTGRIPYPGLDLRGVSPGLAHIISRATKMNQEDRYQSVAEFLYAITAYELSKDRTAHPTNAFETALADAKRLLAKGTVDENNLLLFVNLLLRFDGDSDLPAIFRTS